MDIELNLDEIITALKKRWNDLQFQLIHLFDPDPERFHQKRGQLLKLMSDLDEEILQQTRIRDDAAAAKVVIQGITQQEVDDLNAALKDLNKAIQADEVWHRVISLATTVLGASATLRKAVENQNL